MFGFIAKIFGSKKPKTWVHPSVRRIVVDAILDAERVSGSDGFSVRRLSRLLNHKVPAKILVAVAEDEGYVLSGSRLFRP